MCEEWVDVIAWPVWQVAWFLLLNQVWSQSIGISHDIILTLYLNSVDYFEEIRVFLGIRNESILTSLFNVLLHWPVFTVHYIMNWLIAQVLAIIQYTEIYKGIHYNISPRNRKKDLFRRNKTFRNFCHGDIHCYTYRHGIVMFRLTLCMIKWVSWNCSRMCYCTVGESDWMWNGQIKVI